MLPIRDLLSLKSACLNLTVIKYILNYYAKLHSILGTYLSFMPNISVF